MTTPLYWQKYFVGKHKAQDEDEEPTEAASELELPQVLAQPLEHYLPGPPDALQAVQPG